jgi:hypothetical protein
MIDSEIYALKLEEASGKEPEDWNMECCTCDRSLDYVSLPILGEEQTIVPELDLPFQSRDKQAIKCRTR